MTKLLSRMDTAAFWRIMFFMMWALFTIQFILLVWVYTNPRIVTVEKEVYLIIEEESRDQPIYRTRAI